MASPAITDTITATRVSSATMAAHLRVIIDANGELAAAGAGDLAVGYLTERGAVANQPATYRRASAPEQIAVAHAAIAVGDTVFGAAAGRVDAVGNPAIVCGVATSAATNQDDLITFEKTESTSLDNVP
jgi:hypothetical protein